MPEKKRLLIIDDDFHVRQTLCEVLKGFDYDVSLAANGWEGISMIDKVHPDVVITDILMPEQEGLETILKIRKEHDHVKLIAMSGGAWTAKGNYLSMAKKLGADFIFTKPVDIKQLKNALQELTK